MSLIADDVNLLALRLAALLHAPHAILDIAQRLSNLVIVLFPPLRDSRNLR